MNKLLDTDGCKDRDKPTQAEPTLESRTVYSLVVFMRQKVAEVLPIQDAMNNLAAIASIRIDAPPPIGVVSGFRIVTNPEELEGNEAKWLSEEGAEVVLDALDKTYLSVLRYLQNLYENANTNWESKKTKEGISAMMSLVGESASKMNAYLTYRLGKALETKIEDRNAFQELQHFYSKEFKKITSDGVEGKGAWEGAWAKNSSGIQDLEPNLRDFETLLKDREYELFCIANEEGELYLNQDLLRNVKLTVDFDLGSKNFEEDPFLKMGAMLDRDLHASAGQILQECHEEIEQFYKIAKRALHYGISQQLSKAMTALFVAANPRYLKQATEKKHTQNYFADFQSFLRLACASPEYQKWIAYPPPKSDHDAHLLLQFVNKLCFALLFRKGGVKQEAIGMIHRSMRKGAELEESSSNAKSLWQKFLIEDEHLRSLFRHYPSGPLLKTLDVIRHSEDVGVIAPFDPWVQGNIPSQLFSFHLGKKEVAVLRFASPTRQSMIHKAEILDEFRGFLRFYAQIKKKHLLVQLQDRRSWKESARSFALEQLPTHASFSSHLMVLTLPKNTDFYYQKNEYLQLDNAKQFTETLLSILQKGEENGFYFPKQWKKEDILKYAKKTIAHIHKSVFLGKNTLAREEREAFIEIFYQFLSLEAARVFDADSISFTCKDSLDVGSAAAALFYGFLQIQEKQMQKPESIDLLKYLFYWPALHVRERVIDAEALLRAVSALAFLESK